MVLLSFFKQESKNQPTLKKKKKKVKYTLSLYGEKSISDILEKLLKYFCSIGLALVSNGNLWNETNAASYSTRMIKVSRVMFLYEGVLTRSSSKSTLNL